MEAEITRPRRLAAACVLSFLLLLLGATVASADVHMLGTVLASSTRTPAPHAAARAPSAAAGSASAPASASNLAYHGGPVMHGTRTIAVYWEPPGHTSTEAYKASIDQYLADVAAASGTTGNVYATQTLYWDGAGRMAYDSTFAGRVVDTDPYPVGGCQISGGGPCVTGEQMQSELASFVAADGLPRNAETLYLLLTPAGVDSCEATGWCAGSAWCAYHSWVGSGPDALLYAVLPDVSHNGSCWPGTSPNGDDADTTINMISHETLEAATDPQGTGWIHGANAEIGDLCAWRFGVSLGGTATGEYNQLINGHPYFLQQEFSNATSSCVSSNAGAEPLAASLAPPSGTVPIDSPATLTASANGPDPTIVSYAWDFGDGASGAGENATHSYAAPGTYLATVTVTDGQGATATASAYVTVVDQPNAAVRVSEYPVHSGRTLTLDGTRSSSPAGPIASYAWTFWNPDGTQTTATGLSTTHVFPAPGDYRVDLTVTDGLGMTATDSETIVVSAPAPPKAVISPATAAAFVGAPVGFYATSSTGTDSSIASYGWDFGDGSQTTGSQTTHAYATAGTYLVTLTVTDGAGETASATTAIVVLDAPAVPGPPLPAILAVPRQPPPAPPATPTHAGTTSVTRQTAAVSPAGLTHLTITCTGGAPCSGTLVLATRRPRSTAGQLVIARQTYTIAAGRHSVRLRVSRQGRALLTSRRVRLLSSLVVTSAAQPPAVAPVDLRRM